MFLQLNSKPRFAVVPTDLVTLRILNTHNSNLVFVRIPTI
ncbi:hypothetical protein LEP1GSC034_3354 [Leptospira interrogans str. 2003000735]|nr:hypothetical protein LEP1GSC034_3354 [Leptospira interrogans str. 2003000735]